MREVAPDDLIFSFMDTMILAVGIAQSYCWESPKPLEFGSAGQNWENVGWKVRVIFAELANKVRPKDHMGILRPLLPDRYPFSRTEMAFNPLSRRGTKAAC
jgi:putative restriction endonuclease